jgi:hypothetical protein
VSSLAGVRRLQHFALERDWRAGEPRSSAIEKQPHAERFLALCSNQSKLTPYVIPFAEVLHLCFVKVSAPLESRNPPFDGPTEPGLISKPSWGMESGSMAHPHFLSYREFS